MRNLSLIVFLITVINAQVDTLVTINASSYSNWIYYSLDSHSIVDIENPENSLEWDLAFQRKHIKTNANDAKRHILEINQKKLDLHRSRKIYTYIFTLY